jgi:Heparinase II/III-like protein
MDLDQSVSGGPFLWSQHARSRLLAVDGLEEQTSLAFWQAEHSGYVSRGGPVHRRTVTLNRGSRVLTIQDEIYGKNIASAALCFHLGPAVQCELKANAATLTWTGGGAILELPSALNWSLHRGEENPPLGWFSPRFDVKIPIFTLLGTGSATVGKMMISQLRVL